MGADTGDAFYQWYIVYGGEHTFGLLNDAAALRSYRTYRRLILDSEEEEQAAADDEADEDDAGQDKDDGGQR